MSNYFSAVNRNKKSIALNLKHAKGREIFLTMVRDADVVVENLRPGNMEKLQLGYDDLRKVNQGIILASTSGYGPSGPFENRAGYDMIAGAEAGLLHLTGERGGGPVRPGLGLTDMSTGLYMHGAIMAALYARQRTGEGQKINGSLFETQVALLTNVALSWLNLGVEAERWGAQHASIVPYDAFKTKDLYFVCGATNDKQFANLARILGRPEMAQDERFQTNGKRVTNREQLYPILHHVFATKTTDEWMQSFEGSGMPYAPINNMERVFEHPQTDAREMVAEVPLSAAVKGKIKLLGPAVKFSHTKATIRTVPPLHGEHTEEVLRELGVTDLEGLEEEGVIKRREPPKEAAA
jgi:succinate--hydroxymethylglutarate CoA-transferase